jgi:IclR family transcriptional regulator, KDG regulon repressor
MNAVSSSLTKKARQGRKTAGGGRHLVKSAQRVVEVLEYFDWDRRAARVNDICSALSYPQSSTSELLRSLAALGYLYYNRSRRTYSPTARVTLLGAWVEPDLFRAGKAFAAVDRIAERTGETVVISSGGQAYMVYYIHVVQGANDAAIRAHVGQCEPLLHCPQGEVLLASYPDREIRLALHRLNIFETTRRYQFDPLQKFTEMQALRERGWKIAPTGLGPQEGAVSVLLPRRRGGDRLVLSVLGAGDVIQRRGEEILAILLEERELLSSTKPEEATRWRSRADRLSSSSG